MSDTPAISGVLEAALYVDDLDAAAGFYGDLLGLEEVIRHDPRHIFYRAGETIVLLFVAHETRIPPSSDTALPVPPHGATGPGHLCFNVPGDALDDWRARIEAAGIEIEADFRWPNGARSVYLRDPAGNSIEFAEPKLWERRA
ncbi:glyoxalase/bleomycin resistance/extradiol dioxygenase family protein [Aquicoccus porphyridii]|uniref:Glyoxalase/bleomycin resistance/extradiol dioxygenase family protein n=1 Tax=Aquicoccus porphyridii TaxID=1852029 RepID=A0A5A9ZV52_9RHOB|nr:VOC family protein [Aquicoccus porphyridii]KAA0921080.1 glyoxalase/bleomycin resistance/extradiol dioxygenase family protein [Aquicoccus porphyridii]RAI56385.1 glyoxalase/bleomycin resistance/extradiol dioxygenase family protein [Rhodobacteraceae bacterium AsT-22]